MTTVPARETSRARQVVQPSWLVTDLRKGRWQQTADTLFDVVVLGGGINGACLYDRLCSQGYRVCLLDARDFASGTSQASGMMIWGGLLYLRNLDLRVVLDLSAARDEMIDDVPGVQQCSFRYVFADRGGRGRLLIGSLLHLYWALSRWRRRRPRGDHRFAEACLLKGGAPRGSMLYEEGMLDASDARFVLQWIAPHEGGGNVALNHASVEAGGYNSHDRAWTLQVSDTIGTAGATVRTRAVVNCTGVWTDTVNARFGIASPYRHVLSKGVYVALEREPEHETPMIFEMGQHGDLLTWVPWGPVSLFGPTETIAPDLEAGFRVETEDLRFLLEHADQRLAAGVDASRIVSLRCGVRPLVVPNGHVADQYPLDLSRRSRVVEDPSVPWISSYGGKLTGCLLLADELAGRVARRVAPSRQPSPELAGDERGPPTPEQWMDFPGLAQAVPTPEWCLHRESCCTLADYLRRRTNIAQWIPREGLGRQGENLPLLRSLARRGFARDEAHADSLVDEYVQGVRTRFDDPLSRL